MSDRKAVIKNADMSEEMQQDAVDCATQALEKYNIEKVCVTTKLLSHYTLYLFVEVGYQIFICNGNFDFFCRILLHS